MGRLIGRVIATEKKPTTIDKFCFWTEQKEKLNAFDIVKVKHFDGSDTFGVIENISHITDAQSFLTNFISSDFGDVNIEEPTFRVGMNYAEAQVSYNKGGLYTPVHNNAEVYLADADEITFALGLENIENPLVCGFLKMYEGTPDEITLPVHINSRFLLGREGAHLNISGITGLASKTSYAMFLMKAIQDQYLQREINDSVAFVIFNVKGKDLMAIDRPNDFDGKIDLREKTFSDYTAMGLTTEPFKNVQYFIPFSEPTKVKRSTYLDSQDVDTYIEDKKLKKYKYIYEDDKESIEMMFANVDDPQQTMESIISKIIDNDDPDFSSVATWTGCMEIVSKKSQKGFGSKDKDKEKEGFVSKSDDISVLSWRKFKRVFRKAMQDDMFANRPESQHAECRLGDALKTIKPNDVYVIDIAKLPEDKQSFVFGDTMRTLYNLKLGEYDDNSSDIAPPSRLVVFVDELNKYASKDVPKSSPILREILEVTERGRSLGIILFAAEQFRSNIVGRVTGNCSTHAYGRTNAMETSTGDYSSLPATYKNILTRLEQGDYLIQNPLFRSMLKIHFPLPIYKQFK
jgi:DNA helicase HerA-like ATPase